MSHLRKALLTDMPVLLSSAKEFIKYLDNGIAEWDEERCQEILTNLILHHYIMVAIKDGEIVGGIGGVISPSLWSAKTIILEECFWWVDPNIRNSSIGYRLLKDFIKFAKDNKYKPVFHLLSHSPVTTRGMEKLGFKLKEHTFYME